MTSEKYVRTSDLATIIFFTLLVYWLWCRRHFYRFGLHFPGKLGLPIIGALLEFKHIDFVLSAITKMFCDCKAHTVFTWIGTYPVLITQDSIVAEKVLQSSSLLTKASPLYDVMNDAFQGGIVTSPESEWRIHRKLINPVFKQSVLLSFFPIFNKAKNYLIDQFRDETKFNKNNEVNVLEIVRSTMFRVASETVMGSKGDTEDYQFQKYRSPYNLIFRKVTILTIHAFLNTYKIFKYDRSFTKDLKVLLSLPLDLVEQRRQKETHAKVSGDDAKSGDKQTIFIDQVLGLWREGIFSWQNVISESNTMMTASIETTSNALFSAILMLAMHPPVQRRLYEELTAVFDGNNIDVELEHLSRLPYLEMVVQETLRLAPSVPIIGRQTLEDFELCEGVTVPRGVQIWLSIFHIHRNKDIWGPNADKFDPDNFLPEKQSKRHSHAYIPFSKGKRNCIGYRYAMFALKIMLIGLVSNYEFDTDFLYEELEIVNYMTLAYKREPRIKAMFRSRRS